ncbi:MAG: preprotein translocase subunit SecE [Acidobacteria bacterium]|nr:preprotein translocase subunit SecE [Acidobacteriota bacterium]
MGNADSIKAAAGDEPEKESAIGGAISEAGSWPKRAKTFLGEVRAETKRVSWPGWPQIKATTVVVMITVAFFATYFGTLDWIFTQGVRALLELGK